MALNTFTVLYSHHRYPFLEVFPHPKQKLCLSPLHIWSANYIKWISSLYVSLFLTKAFSFFPEVNFCSESVVYHFHTSSNILLGMYEQINYVQLCCVIWHLISCILHVSFCRLLWFNITLQNYVDTCNPSWFIYFNHYIWYFVVWLYHSLFILLFTLFTVL